MDLRPCPLKKAALEAPLEIAFLSKEKKFTFQELNQKADQFALRLQKEGVLPGERIAIFPRPDESFIALFFAAWRKGITLCPLNTRLGSSQIQTHLERLSPSLFISSLDPWETQKHPSIWKNTSPFLLLFTSGSTAEPKIAALTQENLLASALFSLQALDLKKNDQWLLSLPLFHVGGIGILLRCILAQATLVTDENVSTITHLSCVPTHLYRTTPVYPCLRCLLLGGAPVAHYPTQLPVYVTYGLTEMGSLVLVRKRPLSQEGGYNLGFPLPKREIRIDPEGQIWVKGACLFQGYWEKGIARLPLDEDGWFATGDIGRFCPEQGVAILGRKDWQFISGGENIQPEEIEQVLLTLPEILEAVVVPISDAEFGQRPAAVIRTCDPTFDLKKMRTLLQDRLPKYKIPITLFVFDEIPKKGLKIDRKVIFNRVNVKKS